MAKSKRSVEKEEFWRLVLDEYQRSGLTARAFCEQQGISAPSFYAWRRKIQKRDSRGRQTPTADQNCMVPVNIVDTIRSRPNHDGTVATSLIEIVTPTGFTLRVDQAMLPQRIAALLDLITRGEITGASSC
jgi:transposase-like protein